MANNRNRDIRAVMNFPDSSNHPFCALMNLTQKQRSILTVIVSFISTHKYSPSIQDICLYTGLKSSSTAHGYLERMRKLGYID
ncbi:hypothetical protein G9U52_34190 [Paenibacillus sp. S3N08]|uniref:LexA repressor DNA-binding domain-containing protein n=2 Tax=Paenibacillus agricola TaxID=2716264 RepID=A0ABX0JKZ4_9BACL|nr:hypothetical protein [Paenibacillus agricola]